GAVHGRERARGRSRRAPRRPGRLARPDPAALLRPPRRGGRPPLRRLPLRHVGGSGRGRSRRAIRMTARFDNLMMNYPLTLTHFFADRFTADGWFRTGDVATIDAEGYVQITDRTKDLIKSGGEWISSVDVENLIMAHPKVLEAAVIAVPHPKWVERPLACVVPKPGCVIEPPEILDFLRPKLARWALPDEVEIIDAVPKTSVGKFDKKVLRERYRDWRPKDAKADA